MKHLETIAERRDRLLRDADRRNLPAMRRALWAGKAERRGADRPWAHLPVTRL